MLDISKRLQNHILKIKNYNEIFNEVNDIENKVGLELALHHIYTEYGTLIASKWISSKYTYDEACKIMCSTFSNFKELYKYKYRYSLSPDFSDKTGEQEAKNLCSDVLRECKDIIKYSPTSQKIEEM